MGLLGETMRKLTILLLTLFLAACTGEASEMAANQPRSHDFSVLDEGTDRHRVVAELGEPLLSEEEDGRKIDIFRFVDGYSNPSRTGRTFVHGALNITTFGIWDLFGRPIESAFDGEEVKLKVEYDENDRVAHVIRFDDE